MLAFNQANFFGSVMTLIWGSARPCLRFMISAFLVESALKLFEHKLSTKNRQEYLVRLSMQAHTQHTLNTNVYIEVVVVS
jgi:hypothetical protein